jgi:hypothetical protein
MRILRFPILVAASVSEWSFVRSLALAATPTNPKVVRPLLIGALSCLAVANTPAGELRIDADFPGGNIVVEKVAGDVVHVRADLRDTKGWWFYWYFRVRGAEGRTLIFQFNDRALGLLGPAVSRDGGRMWQWLKQRESITAFKHTFGRDESEVRFSFGMPYQHADLQRFLARHADGGRVRTEILGRTGKGTPVEMLRVGDVAAPFKVWITCRHHACEMMASYVLEGIIDETVADSDAGTWLRRHVDFLIVPMVDKDGVEAGDQGKNRQPHDHAADYTGPSIYPEVAALRAKVREWAPAGPHVTLDLHNPSIGHQVIYTHGLRTENGVNPWNNAREDRRANARRFLDTLERVQRGPLPFRVQDSIEFAQRKAKESEQDRAPANLAAADAGPGVPLRPDGFRCTFDVPYALVRDTPVTTESAQAFGRDIARALHMYLFAFSKTPSP